MTLIRQAEGPARITDKTQLKRDLVFFDHPKITDRVIDHVAIHLENDQLLHTWTPCKTAT